MRIAIVCCLAGCAIQTSSSTSSSGFGSRSSQQAQTQGDPAATGQNASDNRDPGGPSRQPPAGLSTEIALSPPPVKNQDGIVVGPGGPVSDAPAQCGPARGHCVRGSYFANTSDGYLPVFIFEGQFYRWNGEPARQDYAYKTALATPATMANATKAVVFEPRNSNALNTLPETEKEALVIGGWTDVSINRETVDNSAATFETPGGHKFRFDQTRVLLDWIHAK